MDVRYIARKAEDPRGAYGYDIEVDGVVVGHVYEQATDLVGVRWRASLTLNGQHRSTARHTRRQAVANAIALTAQEA